LGRKILQSRLLLDHKLCCGEAATCGLGEDDERDPISFSSGSWTLPGVAFFPLPDSPPWLLQQLYIREERLQEERRWSRNPPPLQSSSLERGCGSKQQWIVSGGRVVGREVRVRLRSRSWAIRVGAKVGSVEGEKERTALGEEDGHTGTHCGVKGRRDRG
jgi:hypothetical protein